MEREGDDERQSWPVVGNMVHVLDCCASRTTPAVYKSFKERNVHPRSGAARLRSFLNMFQPLNLVNAAHAQTRPEILHDDLSAGCSSAMNERNCSEVGVYGGPRSLGGENQS